MKNMFTKPVARELDPTKTYIIEVARDTYTMEQVAQLREALKYAGITAVVAVTRTGDELNIKEAPTTEART